MFLHRVKKKWIMRLLKKYLPKIHFHIATYFYLLFSMIGGYFHLYFVALIIVFIHELCHLMMAYYFQFDIEKIEVLPFGAYLSIRDFYFHPIYEELCVVLAGPCSHLFMFLLIEIFAQGELKMHLLTFNSYVFYFNLLPIYPMDGQRIISLLLQSLIDLKNALYLSLKLSVLSFAVLSVFYLNKYTFIIISFLIYEQFNYMKYIPQYLRNYYSNIPSLYDRKKYIVNHCYVYRRGYHNYYEIDSYLYDETRVIYALLKNIKS